MDIMVKTLVIQLKNKVSSCSKSSDCNEDESSVSSIDTTYVVTTDININVKHEHNFEHNMSNSEHCSIV